MLQQVTDQGEITKPTEPEFINAELRDKDDPEIVLNIKLPGTERRESTSSEDKIDTSDELMEVDCDKFIADCQAEVMRSRKDVRREAMPEHPEQYNEYPGEKIIREAESARARAFKPTGNSTNLNNMRQALNQSAHHSVMDEEHLVIGGHVDSSLQQKIIDFEYVDFSHLLPKDRITRLEDHRYELVMRGGSTFFAPIADKRCN